MSDTLQIEVRDSLAAIDRDAWNALSDSGNPFVRHEFLLALEQTGCLGRSTGWHPRHFLLWRIDPERVSDEQDHGSGVGEADDHRSGHELVGAVPAYLKTNSYGEFVFDWAWADAYQRYGVDYYPKLVASVPFTPATGPRLLVRPDMPWASIARLLAGALVQFSASEDYSSVHYLFVTEREAKALAQPLIEPDIVADKGDCASGEADPDDTQESSSAEAAIGATAHLTRLDVQYHWHNAGYTSWDHFLASCTSKRRKTLHRERRHVTDAGLRLERRLGHTLDDAEWAEVHGFYASTFDRKWGNPSLTDAFFRRMGQEFGSHTLVVFAYDPTDATPARPVACSVMFIGDDTLYGRYWGCRRDYNSLHFETCYYQGIEFCIEHGIAHFEPGAQGEHKITRGFTPTITRSMHWIHHPAFRDAIAGFLAEERPHVERRCSGLMDLLPFRMDSLDLQVR